MFIEEEFEILVTRASECVRCTEDSASSSTPVQQKKSSLLKRNSVFLKCEQHCLKTRDKTKSDTWTDVNTNCRSCINLIQLKNLEMVYCLEQKKSERAYLPQELNILVFTVLITHEKLQSSLNTLDLLQCLSIDHQFNQKTH